MDGAGDGIQAGWPGFDARKEQEIFLYPTASRPILGRTQSPNQWVLRTFSGVKRSWLEAEANDSGPITPLAYKILPSSLSMSHPIRETEQAILNSRTQSQSKVSGQLQAVAVL
jgi:hypothetical protein